MWWGGFLTAWNWRRINSTQAAEWALADTLACVRLRGPSRFVYLLCYFRQITRLHWASLALLDQLELHLATYNRKKYIETPRRLFFSYNKDLRGSQSRARAVIQVLDRGPRSLPSLPCIFLLFSWLKKWLFHLQMLCLNFRQDKEIKDDMLSASVLFIRKAIDFLEGPLSGLLPISHLPDMVTWPP